jgi:hypothetical protein
MNDDLGNFPTPNSPTTPTSTPPKETYTPPAFEPTPDEIPSANFEATPKPTIEPISEPIVEPAPTPTSEPIQENKVDNSPLDNIFPELKTPDSIPTPLTNNFAPITPASEPTLATVPPETKSPTSSLISIVLLLIAGVGITGSVFLYSQSAALKKQLTDITKTIDQQKTTITPTPSPTIIDIPSPTPTPEASEEAVITPTPTASPSSIVSKEFIPLALAPQALKVGINHEPNAQLILIKAENATNPDLSLIKYYFRKDLTTKKYFYVSINGKNESEINDNAIYVNPDNNIPSLNDQVLGNKLGIDFEEAYDIATKLCTASCTDMAVNAQFIKSGTNNIWQLTIDPTNKKHIVQINSQTKAVLFKSPNI